MLTLLREEGISGARHALRDHQQTWLRELRKLSQRCHRRSNADRAASHLLECDVCSSKRCKQYLICQFRKCTPPTLVVKLVCERFDKGILFIPAQCWCLAVEIATRSNIR